MQVLLIHDADEMRARVIHTLSTGLPSAQLELWDPTRQGAPGREFPWHHFDCVLLDERPGNSDGIDWLLVLRRARAAGVVPPTVLLVGKVDASREARARVAGAADVVRKASFAAADVEQMLTRAAARRPRKPTAPVVPVLPVVSVVGEPKTAAAAPRPHAKAVLASRLAIPGYTLVAKIGAGGMAQVFLAERDSDGLVLVLKILDPRLNEDSQFRKRFEREQSVLARITNDHVVRIYDYGMTETYGYLAMEYFPGDDLKSRLTPPGLPIALAIDYFVQILRALEAVHGASVVHRDLKPQNILFRANGQLALVDFGLARELDSETTLTQKGMVIATPLYMSPEQCLGLEHGPRGDLYSLGVILYEMLTGELPFRGATPPELAQQHVRGAIPTLPSHLVSLQPLLNMLLAKRVEQRPPSARAILDKLEQR